MAATIEDLKIAAELVEKPAALVRKAAKVGSLSSEAARRSVSQEIVRIRLKVMLMRRDLTILHDLANRRKPRKAKKRAEE